MCVAPLAFAQENARDILLKSQQKIDNAKAFYGEYTLQIARPPDPKSPKKTEYVTFGKLVYRRQRERSRTEFRVGDNKLVTYDDYQSKTRLTVYKKKYLKSTFEDSTPMDFGVPPDLSKGAYTSLGKRTFQKRKVFWIERVEDNKKDYYFIDCITFLPLQITAGSPPIKMRFTTLSQNLNAIFDESLLIYTPPPRRRRDQL